MPAALLIPAIASVAAGGATAAASIYGSKKAAEANKRATEVQSKSDADALAYAKEQEARNRADWEAREQRRQPYRDSSQQALMRLSQIAGLPAPSMPTSRTMPVGWTAATAAPGQVQSRTMPLRSLIQPSGSRALLAQSPYDIPAPGQWEV